MTKTESKLIERAVNLPPFNAKSGDGYAGIPHLWCEVGEGAYQLLAKGDINALRKSMALHAKIMTGVFIKHPNGQIEEAKPCETAFEDALRAATKAMRGEKPMCATCKHWESIGRSMGICKHEIASVAIGKQEPMVPHDFGCIHHEPKPLEQENSAFGAHLRNER